MAITPLSQGNEMFSHESLGKISPFLKKGVAEFQQIVG
jgi:hypothetical protein